jgi:hypothetical protein
MIFNQSKKILEAIMIFVSWDRGAQECIPIAKLYGGYCYNTQKVNPYRNFLNSVEDGPISIANNFTMVTGMIYSKYRLMSL